MSNQPYLVEMKLQLDNYICILRSGYAHDLLKDFMSRPSTINDFLAAGDFFRSLVLDENWPVPSAKTAYDVLCAYLRVRGLENVETKSLTMRAYTTRASPEYECQCLICVGHKGAE